jgi:hypothetical protein
MVRSSGPWRVGLRRLGWMVGRVVPGGLVRRLGEFLPDRRRGQHRHAKPLDFAAPPAGAPPDSSLSLILLVARVVSVPCGQLSRPGDSGQMPPSRPPTQPARDHPTPTRQASRRNPTQEGLPDPAILPTDRNRNLAITPIKRAGGCCRSLAVTPILLPCPLVQLFLLFPDPGCTCGWWWCQGCRRHRGATRSVLDTPPPTVTTIKKSGQSNDQAKGRADQATQQDFATAPGMSDQPAGIPPISSVVDHVPPRERVKLPLWITRVARPTRQPDRRPTNEGRAAVR